MLSFTRQIICLHSAHLFMGHILSHKKQLLCNSNRIFLKNYRRSTKIKMHYSSANCVSTSTMLNFSDCRLT